MNRTTATVGTGAVLSALLYAGWLASQPVPAGHDVYLEGIGVEYADGGEVASKFLVGARLVGLPPDGGVVLDPDLYIERTVPESAPYRTVPSIGLDAGVYVERWPGGALWPCAVAEPGATGCEHLERRIGESPAWAPAATCQSMEPGEWRGASCTPKPCGDPAELGGGPAQASMPQPCRDYWAAYIAAQEAARLAAEAAAHADAGLAP